MARGRVVIHSSAAVERIRAAAAAAAAVRDALAMLIRPGMTTLGIDQLGAQLIRNTGGQSAFFGYRGFPAQVCVSVNDEVVHGIGNASHVIEPGDLVSVDIGVRLNGYIGDTATTVCAGMPSTDIRKRLIETTRQSLDAGIAAVRVGGYISDIGKAVEAVARAAGFSVVRDFVGHGCGRDLHEPPEVPNFAQHERGPRMQPGMVLAIEPMVNTGTDKVVVDSDGWTVRTADRGLSAHFEHMVLITNGKPEILTWPRTA